MVGVKKYNPDKVGCNSVKLYVWPEFLNPISPLSQKLIKLRPFSWVKSWQNIKFIKFSNLKISLTFWDLDQFFFSCEVNLCFWKHTQSFKVKQQFRALQFIQALCLGLTKVPITGTSVRKKNYPKGGRGLIMKEG